MCETPKAFTSITRKARKLHTCCECRTQINPGDQYQYSSGVWDEPASFKQCLFCHMLMSKAIIFDQGYIVGFGGLSEWVYGHMSIHFKGREFLNGMAEMLDVTAEELNVLLKMKLETLQ